MFGGEKNQHTEKKFIDDLLFGAIHEKMSSTTIK